MNSKQISPNFFSESLGFCSEGKEKFELKEDVTRIFRPKRQATFATMTNIDKELQRPEILGVIKKMIIVPGQALPYTQKRKATKEGSMQIIRLD